MDQRERTLASYNPELNLLESAAPLSQWQDSTAVCSACEVPAVLVKIGAGDYITRASQERSHGFRRTYL